MTSRCWVCSVIPSLRASLTPSCSPAVSLEQNVLPSIGASLVPDDLIRRLGKSLQTASRLYELDLPDSGDDSSPPTPTPAATTKDEQQPVAVSSSSSSSGKETRFDPDFDRQAKGSDMYGTTAEVVEVGRERFAYWCFDLLFLLCSDEVEGESNAVQERAPS